MERSATLGSLTDMNAHLGQLILRSSAIVALAASGLWAATPVEAAHPGSNGRVAYFALQEFEENEYYIASVAADGSDEQVLIDHSYEPGIPAFSPDGSRLAFTCQMSGDNRVDLCLAQADGSDIETISVDGDTKDPDWSPSGERLVMVCKEGSDQGICVYELETGELEMIAEGGLYPAWSALGKIAYQGEAKGKKGLVVTGPRGNRKRVAVRSTRTHRVQELDWYPTGKRIFYVALDKNDEPTIFSVRRDGSHRKKIVKGGFEPTLSPDGTTLLFTHRGSFKAFDLETKDTQMFKKAKKNAWLSFADWQPR